MRPTQPPTDPVSDWPRPRRGSETRGLRARLRPHQAETEHPRQARTTERESYPLRVGRNPFLDGVRGVAALIAIFHHLYLVAEPVLRQQGGTGVGSVFWWISQTPFKLLTAGSEVVLVFFVLSGLVVALPALNPGGFLWAGFLTGRLARLHLPVWASLVIDTAFILLLPRTIR